MPLISKMALLTIDSVTRGAKGLLTDLWGRVSQSRWELQCNAVLVKTVLEAVQWRCRNNWIRQWIPV